MGENAWRILLFGILAASGTGVEVEVYRVDDQVDMDYVADGDADGIGGAGDLDVFKLDGEVKFVGLFDQAGADEGVIAFVSFGVFGQG